MLRDHYTAKRALDYKKEEDSRYLYLEHVISGGSLWTDGQLTFQFQEEKGDYHNFSMIKDHPEIIQEAYDILHNAIQGKKYTLHHISVGYPVRSLNIMS